MVLDHLLSGLVEYASNEQGNKSVSKAIKEGGKGTLDRIIKRMCEPSKRLVTDFSLAFLLIWNLIFSARRAMIVDLALSLNGSQLIASVLPNVSIFWSGLLLWCSDVLILQADKDQRAQLYDCIRSHIVTLRGCKTGSKVIWLLYVFLPSIFFARTHFVEATEWYC